MANVLFAARTAVATSFNAVTGAAVGVNAAVTAFTELANTAAAHATEFRKQQEQTIRNTSDERAIVGTQEARMAIAERLRTLQAKLAADPELAALYDKAGAELDKLHVVKPAA